MVICHIWDADYPWDIRVEKVCRSLGVKHEVHLVCRNANRWSRSEKLDGLSIHRLPFLPKWFGFCNAMMGFPLFFNPVWLFTIWATVRRTDADLILVRDLPLALTAIAVGRWFGIPILLDLAENYPAMLKDRLRYTPTSFMGRIVRHPALAAMVERTVLRNVDHIIVVVEESRDRLVQMGIPQDRITIVSNTPLLDRWEQGVSQTGNVTTDDVPHLVYLGNLDGSRGIDTAIEAIGVLKDRGEMARLSIIGMGQNLEQFRTLSKVLGVEDRVSIMGRLPFSDLQPIMARANIGLIPHYSTDAWNTTIPNKLFDFMAMGKPVIVSSARPTERIVRSEECGLVFVERTKEDLASTILELRTRSAREQLGRNGRAAFLKRWNWAFDEQLVYEALDHTVRRKR
ncbi:MAG: glycosyltransferase family 4 protein [Nitrospira sp.]|nr:glycosyltransferase family 4 protein [Nitrospira sp.]